MGITSVGGNHLTGLPHGVNLAFSGPPRSFRSRALQARGMASPFGRHGGHLLRSLAGNEILIAHRLVGDGQFEHSVKHHATAAGAAAVEAEHILDIASSIAYLCKWLEELSIWQIKPLANTTEKASPPPSCSECSRTTGWRKSGSRISVGPAVWLARDADAAISARKPRSASRCPTGAGFVGNISASVRAPSWSGRRSPCKKWVVGIFLHL